MYVLSVPDQVLTSTPTCTYTLRFKIRILMYLMYIWYLLCRHYISIRKYWKDVQNILRQYLTDFSGGSIPDLQRLFIIFILLTIMYTHIWGKVHFRM